MPLVPCPFFKRFAQPLREEIRANAERLAAEAGIGIEFVRKSTLRKESRIKEVLARRGEHPGRVHILSAMEACPSYRPWHDKQTHETYLKPVGGKCLHYYFYFIDEELGLCYLRVPTWCPFRLQFYFNGHGWLARQLDKRSVGYKLLDNAFTHVDDFQVAQSIADGFPLRKLHRALNRFARRYIQGLRNVDLRKRLPDLSSGQVSRLLKRLRVHSLIKRIGCTYKYYVTAMGRRVLLAGLQLKHWLIPLLASP